MLHTLPLTGRDLKPQDFYDVALRGRRVTLGPRARHAMQRSRALVEKMIAEKRVVYGVTTGVGSLSTERLEPDKVRQLPLNIVRSHVCSVADRLNAEETRVLRL